MTATTWCRCSDHRKAAGSRAERMRTRSDLWKSPSPRCRNLGRVERRHTHAPHRSRVKLLRNPAAHQIINVLERLNLAVEKQANASPIRSVFRRRSLPLVRVDADDVARSSQQAPQRCPLIYRDVRRLQADIAGQPISFSRAALPRVAEIDQFVPPVPRISDGSPQHVQPRQEAFDGGHDIARRLLSTKSLCRRLALTALCCRANSNPSWSTGHSQ